MTDDYFMKICLELSKKALYNGDPPVGALLVLHDEIIGEGIESGRSSNDITHHAEILAVKDAIAKGNKQVLNQSTMYTTHEPCIMCSYVLRHHNIYRIVYGTAVDHIGGHTSDFGILKTTDVPSWKRLPKVTAGVCKNDCDNLTLEFVKRLNDENPSG